MNDEVQPPWAGFWRRIGAFVMDTLIIGVPAYLICFEAFDAFAALGEFGRLIGLVVATAYFGVFGSKIGDGRTPGKRLFKLRVVGLDGSALGLDRALGRSFVLMLPIILNGLFIRDTNSVAALAFGVIAVTAVFGVGLAQVFLYLFNRPSRQLLHDLLFGSVVVRLGGVPLADPTPKVPKYVAYGLVSAVFVLSVGAVSYYSIAKPVILPGLTKVMHASNALPEVMETGVTDNYTNFYPAGSSPTVSRTLVVTVHLRKWPTDLSREFQRIHDVVGQNYALAPGQRMQIRLNYGFDIGIASGSRNQTETYDH
ncbi:MAG TPA: RDD family protein [Caulobacteraceae bacterium]|jgi:uncharacterized RDD family membrane protein YckC